MFVFFLIVIKLEIFIVYGENICGNRLGFFEKDVYFFGILNLKRNGFVFSYWEV